MFFVTIFFGIMLGVLLFIKDYKNTDVFRGSNLWDECIDGEDYGHLVTQGALLGFAGAVTSGALFAIVSLLGA